MHLYRALGFVAPFKPFSAEKHAYILLFFGYKCSTTRTRIFFNTLDLSRVGVLRWTVAFGVLTFLPFGIGKSHACDYETGSERTQTMCLGGVGRHIAQIFFNCGSPGRHTAYIFFGQPTYVYENVSIYNVCCFWALISLFSKIKKYLNRFFSK
jgi:hypothetical protein